MCICDVKLCAAYVNFISILKMSSSVRYLKGFLIRFESCERSVHIECILNDKHMYSRKTLSFIMPETGLDAVQITKISECCLYFR